MCHKCCTNVQLCCFSDGDGKWLEAFYDPVANIYTFTQCMCFGDIHADGDLKLVLAHLGTGTQDMKLKVFKGDTTEAVIFKLTFTLLAFNSNFIVKVVAVYFEST